MKSRLRDKVFTARYEADVVNDAVVKGLRIPMEVPLTVVQS
jgi:hypothetical protein